MYWQFIILSGWVTVAAAISYWLVTDDDGCSRGPVEDCRQFVVREIQHVKNEVRYCWRKSQDRKNNNSI